MKHFALLMLFSIQLTAQIAQPNLDSLLNQLTLEEKVYLVIGTGMDIPGISEKDEGPQAIVGKTQDKIEGAAGTSYQNKRLGFPAVVFADGPAGIRISPTRKASPEQTYYATAFPTATSLASSWNLELVNMVGTAFGKEGKDYGVDFLLAPALNIHRNPLGGRNFEYYSEDPVLGGKITASFVNGVQSEGVGATIKHFVANNSETNRTELNTVVSERAIREIYLKGFQIALEESKPWAIMSSYNKVNGVYASENKELLTDILRNEWGYEGFVMTDWFAGKDAVEQMKAGNDLLMPGTKQQYKAILEAVKAGNLEETTLNRNVKFILKQYFKTLSFNNYKPTNKPDLGANKKIARQAASEGMVLLKNNNTLPLKKNTKVALFGVTSIETISGGTGSGDVNKAYMVSITQGLKNAGYSLDESLFNAYQAYVNQERAKVPAKKFFFEKNVVLNEKVWTSNELETISNNNDVAIFTLGRTSGEFQDRTVEGDFNLTAQELSTIHSINKAFHSKNKKFIILLNIGGVIETQNWKDLADAILLTWQPGQEAGNAIADIISGASNPSGKLSVTFPNSIDDVASSKNFPGKVINNKAKMPNNPLAGVPSEEIYEEGIYVGYRYFNTFKIPVSYPFGYGLSYTNFEYGNLDLKLTDNQVELTFTIKNTGSVSGKETAQLYVESPNGTLEKPLKELKGFAKTKLLEPGETTQVAIKTHIDHLGYYDTNSQAWKLDKGTYTFHIGSNIDQIELVKNLSLEAKVIQITNPLLSPTISIDELSQN